MTASAHSTPSALAVAKVEKLISQIGDPAEASLVQGILDARLEGRDVPSWGSMTPLMQVADLTLRQGGVSS